MSKQRVVGNRWRVVVELTWDILPEDIEERYPGDAEVDFAARAFERVRPELVTILSDGNSPDEGKFAHFHILERPHRCVE